MNKFYIQIVFFLLIIPLYVNNKTLATELVPKKDTKHKSKKDKKHKSTKRYPTSEEIYKKNKHLLYTDTEETRKACRFMNDALKQLEHHATSKGYKRCCAIPSKNIVFYKKKHQGRTKILKAEYLIKGPNKYNEILNELWDPDSDQYINNSSVKKKIVRVYTPNLVMIQQRCKKMPWSRRKYFYALAAKYKISENKTMIVMASANIIDHNRKNKKYFENKMVESANLFQAEIDSEDDIRNGKIKKTFVNLIGYIVEKRKEGNDEHGSI
ncbi:fam-a protein [Plasmodium yoelii]|uniref:Fam-a protein n=1 Tax=Plasmodium yoelii TaxID=5861 RepID=A0A077Y1F6_PLAYE|nr:fam-a protein [Plasmodium yoelii]CDU16183.1 fam-a protein [Plasmodium yoelii]VTZ77926.1 fam-a protein [Plasmodium yoelii]|eukprot:XP_022811042.1 fam-a protein [Plasmodium yoelii]